MPLRAIIALRRNCPHAGANAPALIGNSLKHGDALCQWRQIEAVGLDNATFSVSAAAALADGTVLDGDQPELDQKAVERLVTRPAR
jgi:hypothetical protein